MNQFDEEKEIKPKNKWYGLFIGIAVALCLFTAVEIGLIIFIVGRDKSAEPKEMVLRDSSNETVLVGTTKEDIKRAMDLAYKWGWSALKGDAEAGREKIEDIAQLIMSGRLVEVSNGTSCLLLESGSTICKVQITEGLEKGQDYWVNRKFVGYPEVLATSPTAQPNIDHAKSITEPPPEEYTFGWGAIASSFAWYFINAFICCVGIYYLRIKGVLLQIVCFILGFIILNLMWIRIASHFMFSEQ